MTHKHVALEPTMKDLRMAIRYARKRFPYDYGDAEEQYDELLAYVRELEDRVDTYYVMWSNVESSMDALKLITNRPEWLQPAAVSLPQQVFCKLCGGQGYVVEPEEACPDCGGSGKEKP